MIEYLVRKMTLLISKETPSIPIVNIEQSDDTSNINQGNSSKLLRNPKSTANLLKNTTNPEDDENSRNEPLFSKLVTPSPHTHLDKSGYLAAPGGSSAAAAALHRPSMKVDTLSKALSRISSLENTIKFIQSEHGNTIKGLHSEIERLQTLNSDLMMRSVLKSEDADKFRRRSTYQALESSIMTFRERKESVMKQTDNVEKQDKTQQEQTDSAADKSIDVIQHRSSKTSLTGDDKVGTVGYPQDATVGYQAQFQQQQQQTALYILVEREKKKYQGMVERMTEENKRKQTELERLKSEIEIIKEVLALAGLKMDLKEFQRIISSRAHAGKKRIEPAVDLKTKAQAVLPPIATGKNEDASEIVILNSIHKHNNTTDQKVEFDSTTDDKDIDTLREFPITRQPAAVVTASGIIPPADRSPNTIPSKLRSHRYKIINTNKESTDNSQIEEEPANVGSTDSSKFIPVVAAHNQNLDYNHHIAMHYGNTVLQEVAEEESGAVQQDFNQTNKSVSQGPSPKSQRRFRMTSNTASVLSGHTNVNTNHDTEEYAVIASPSVIYSDDMSLNDFSRDSDLTSVYGRHHGKLTRDGQNESNEASPKAKRSHDANNIQPGGYVDRQIKSKLLRERNLKEFRNN